MNLTLYICKFNVRNFDSRFTESSWICYVGCGDGNEIFTSLGFNTEDEYIESYPGKCCISSRMLCAAFKGVLYADPTEQYQPICRYYFPQCWSSLFEHIKSIFVDVNGVLCVTPTIEEIKSCKDLAPDIKDGELWFCSDWSES